MKLYYATRAITETIAWAAAWIVLALLYDDISWFTTLVLLLFSCWCGWDAGRASAALKRASQTELDWRP